MTSYSASAQEIQRAALKQGEKAPFAGQLLSDAAVAKLLSDQKAEKAQLQTRIDFLEKQMAQQASILSRTCDVKLEAANKKYEICEGSRKVESSIYDKALSNQCQRSWYESPYFTMGLSVASFVAGGYVSCRTK